MADSLTLLRELHALVKGECPSLLSEDSGGDARLALAIEDVLRADLRAEVARLATEGSGTAPSEGEARANPISGRWLEVGTDLRGLYDRLWTEGRKADAQIIDGFAWQIDCAESERDDAREELDALRRARTAPPIANEPAAPSTLAARSEPERRGEPEYEAVREVLADAAREWNRVQRANDRNTNGVLGASWMDWRKYTTRLAALYARSEGYTRAEALTMAAQWQPIETYHGSPGVVIVWARGLGVTEAAWGPTRREWTISAFGNNPVCHPTHWMPLPEPPRAEERSHEG